MGTFTPTHLTFNHEEIDLPAVEEITPKAREKWTFENT